MIGRETHGTSVPLGQEGKAVPPGHLRRAPGRQIALPAVGPESGVAIVIVDEPLPRNASGKILKRELRDQLANAQQ